jgi:Flp pilus assembly protein TadB
VLWCVVLFCGVTLVIVAIVVGIFGMLIGVSAVVLIVVFKQKNRQRRHSRTQRETQLIPTDSRDSALIQLSRNFLLCSISRF